MKTVFIYFSLTGNLDLVANQYKEKGIDVIKVELLKKFPKTKFFMILKGGFLAAKNAKTPIKDVNLDITNYDLVIIGSPIWNGRLSSPINTVLDRLDLTNKQVEFVFSAGSGEGKKALEKVNSLYNNPKVTFLKEPKKYNEELKKIAIE